MQPIDRAQSSAKNGNANCPSVNDEIPSTEEKQEDMPISLSKQNTAKDSEGLPALKSFTMHGFKDSDSSPNPRGKFLSKRKIETKVL